MNPAEFATLARTEKDLWWFQGMRNILFNIIDSHVRNHAISRVLEAGCGTGLTAKLLHQRYGWMTVAADLSTEGINLAQRSGGIFPVQADIAACPFPGEAFDAVFCLDVLVHFPRGEEMHAIAEFARTLRPGGSLILRTSALDWLRSRHSEFTHERQRFTRERLIRAVEEHGFPSCSVYLCQLAASADRCRSVSHLGAAGQCTAREWHRTYLGVAKRAYEYAASFRSDAPALVQPTAGSDVDSGS
jgi:SAM-dependent methyltransferase